MNYSKINISLICYLIATMAFYELQAQPKFNISVLNEPAPGYLLFDWSNNHDFYLVDNYGNAVNIIKSSNGYKGYFYKVLDNGVITAYAPNKYYLFNYDMSLIDSITVPSSLYLDFHDIINLRNGNYLVLCTQEVITDLSKFLDGGIENAVVVHNVLLEVDTKGNIYWSWSTEDHIQVTDASVPIEPDKAYIDLTHINSMFECSDGDILISIRHLDEVAKINRNTGLFTWRMGGKRCINNQFTFTNDNVDGFYGFSHQHAATILDNGNLLLYDNGNLKPNSYSRAVEYSLNVSNKTATKVWEYRSNPDIFMAALGSAYRLPNGNTLINWGKEKITEVKPDKSIAMEIIYDSYNVYNARKITSLATYSSLTLNTSGTYSFNNSPSNTGVILQVTSISSPLKVHAQKHDYIHENYVFTDSTFSEIVPMRWVLTKDGKSNIAGKIRLQTATIQNLNNPKKATIYKRDKESVGTFYPINTTYNESTKELIADFNSLGEFIVVSNLLTKPELITPINNEIVQLSGKLVWKSQKGVQKYQIQIDTDSKFANPFVNSISLSSNYQYANLVPRTKYYWRVRAMNNKDTTVWSDVLIFSTVQTPILLTYPPNNAQGILLSDSLKWQKQKQSDNYRVQISTEQYFISPIINVLIHEMSYFIINKLSNDSKYFWRVAVEEDPNNWLWSEIRTFETTFQAPILSSPDNHSFVKSHLVNFEWSSIKQVDAYKLELAYDSLFAQTTYLYSELNHSIVKNIELKNGRQYFWRVQSRAGDVFSDWSEIYNFKTPLATPVTFYPQNNELNLDTKVEFKWDNLDENYSYQIQISNKIDFSTILVDSSIHNTDIFTILGLANNSNYFWRIKAYLNEYSSNWSVPVRFRTKLPSPKLTSPKNGRVDFSLYSPLKWELLNGKYSYQLQIANDEKFDNLALDTVTALNEFFIISLYPMTKYYWRVKVFNDSLNSNWSETRNFTTYDGYGIEAPELLNPLDGSDIYVDGYLVWEDFGDGSFYHLQVAADEEFRNVVIDALDLVDYGYKLHSLNINEVYYWRVRIYSKFAHSDWSEVFSFSTIDESELIRLLYPEDYELDINPIVSLKWEEILSASTYELQVSKKPDFKENQAYEKNLKTTNFTLTGLIAATQYYWRVRYTSSSGISRWSPIWSFITKSDFTLSNPSLVEPLNHSAAINILTHFTWQPVDNATKYRFKLSKDPDFKKTIIKYSDLKQTELKCCELEYNTLYFWKVAAYNDSAYSDWSDVISFTTELPKPIITYPDIQDSIINPSLTIKWFSYYEKAKTHLQIAHDPEFNEIELDVKELVGEEYNCKLAHNSEYYVRVTAYTDENSSRWSKPSHFKTKDIESSIFESSSESVSIRNYPNPTANYTIFTIENKRATNFRLSIYDLTGFCVTTIIDEYLEIGLHNFTWNADNLNSGIYYYNLVSDNEIKRGIISLIK